MTDHCVSNLIKSLSKSQRNHLRVILSRETGVMALRSELGIQKATKTTTFPIERDYDVDIRISL
jgi:hypothetical protein